MHATAIATFCLAVPLAAQQLAPAHSPQQVPSGPVSALVADFNGDGFVDLLSLEGFRGDFSAPWRLSAGDGSGLFSRTHAVISPNQARMWSPRPIHTAGDFDGDGDIDVAYLAIYAVSPTLQIAVRIAANDGTGNFTASGTLPNAGIGNWSRVSAADLDQDGDQDLLVRRSGPDDTEVWSNNGSGTFTVTQTFTTTPAHYNTRSQLLDIDNDGDLDYLAGSVWCNQGNGTFLECSAIAPGGLPAGPYALGDLNGDGFEDLLTPSGVWLRNQGSTTLLPGVSLPGAGLASLHDLDNDGDLDAVIGSGWLPGLGSDLIAYLNNGNATFSIAPAGTVPDLADVRWTGALDIDADGDQDLLTSTGYGIGLLLNDSNGRLRDAAPPVVSATDFNVVHRQGTVLDDIDQDGDTDIIAFTNSGLRSFLNNGLGNYAPTPQATPTPNGWDRPHTLADFDGDGLQDLLTQRGDLYAGNGLGGFTLQASGLTSVAAAVGDFDGDSDLDIVSSGAGGYRENLGSFVFAAPSSQPFVGGSHAVTGDFDGDNDIDLLVSGDAWFNGSTTTYSNDRLFVNNGAASFTLVPLLVLTATTTAKQMQVLDFDHDGDQDVACVGVIAGTPSTWIYVNDGAGTLTSSFVTALPEEFSALVAADFDLDGDIDLLLTQARYQATTTRYSLLLEQVNGTFVDSSQAWLNGLQFGFHTSSGDLDNDGDLDLVTWQVAVGATVIHNQRRHLAAPNLGRTGNRFVLEAHCEAPLTEAVFAFLSTQTLALAAPTPFGDLHLGGAPIALSLGAATQASPARWAIAIPAQPNLIGFEMFAQALHLPAIGNPATWRIGNAVRLGVIE